MDPEALSILAGFADGVMRHLTVAKIDASTTAAKKALSDVELKLTQVFKPHTKCVTSIAISGDGKFLATGVSITNDVLICPILKFKNKSENQHLARTTCYLSTVTWLCRDQGLLICSNVSFGRASLSDWNV